MDEFHPHIGRKETRKLMYKLGCAGAMNQVINQSFGNRDEAGEKATGPLCGGMMRSFKHRTGGKILCHQICGQRFQKLDDHSSYLDWGGCSELLKSISES